MVGRDHGPETVCTRANVRWKHRSLQLLMEKIVKCFSTGDGERDRKRTSVGHAREPQEHQHQWTTTGGTLGHWSPNTAPTTTARLTPSRIEARGRYYLFYRRESKGLLQETPGIYRAPIMMYYRVTPIASHCCHSDSPARTTPNRHTPTTL